MANKSTVEALPSPILGELKKKLGSRSATYDEIVAWLEEKGYEISRSAVGRYGKSFKKTLARLQESQRVADGVIAELGDAARMGKTGELLIEVVRTLAFEKGMSLDDGAAVDPESLHFLARAVKDLASAQKIGTDRELKIRQATAKQAADRAVEVAGEEAKKIGQQLPPEALKRIREEIYGIVDRKAAAA